MKTADKRLFTIYTWFLLIFWIRFYFLYFLHSL